MKATNVFAEQSFLEWEEYGDPWKTGHYYATSDGKYRIRPEPSPWEPEDKTKYVWLVQARAYGERYYLTLKAAPIFADAVQYAEKDSQSPVFDKDGDCRWCGMAENDLRAAPRWWFGCNLCEPAIESIIPEENEAEFEPLHD